MDLALLLSVCLVLPFAFGSTPRQNSSSLFPATFVFGDSLADNGNNNYLPTTLARADHPFNGIDYPFGPTGRFSNGKTIIDVISDFVGLRSAPPALSPAAKDHHNFLGLNYASAAAGILESSGLNWKATIPLSGQVDLFADTIKSLQQELGVQKANELISKSLFVFVIGGNDYINNYYINATTSAMYPDMNKYRSLLIYKFTYQLRRMYDLGARKFTIAGTGPLGCLPVIIAASKTNGRCFEPLNEESQRFNVVLSKTLSMLNKLLKGSTYVFQDSYRALTDIIKDPHKYGFDNTNTGCCGAGKFNGETFCEPLRNVTVCKDRKDHIFWDAFHPTEAANKILGSKFFSGGQEYSHPVNIEALSRM